jgi:peptide/nickel transport system substrate-binding protein
MFQRCGTRARGAAFRTVGATAAVLALALAACGNDSTGQSSTTGGEPRDGGTLKFGLPIDDQGGVFFDPAESVPNPAAQIWMDLIYDTMIHQGAEGGEEPGLATKWATPDPNTVELTLRKGVEFSDGDAFNSAAVKAAWERLLASDVADIPAEIRAFNSIEAVDDTNLRIGLSEPVAQTVVQETLKNSFWLGVPSPAAVEAGTVNTDPVGAGPYGLDSYDEGQQITLARNETFYAPDTQHLDEIELIQLRSGPPAVAALETGTVDLIFGVDPEAVERIEAQPGLAITSYESPRVFDLGLCATEGPFASKEARQAIQYAVDRDAINEAALAGTSTPSLVPLTPVSPFYNDSFQDTYEYDPEMARSLLEEAGVEEGTTVQALVPTVTPEPVISDVVQSQLEDVGLDMEITQSTSFVADSARLRPDIAFVFTEPALFSIAFEGGETSLNTCGWQNDDAEAALADTRDSSLSTGQQQEAWDTFQEILLEESPVVYTVVSPLIAGRSDKVQGLSAGSTTYAPSLATVSIEE